MCGGLGGGIFSFLMATDTAAASAKVNRAKVAARDARNERSAAESELQRFNQSLGNKKILEAAGRRYEALSENLNRRLDAAAYGGAMASLALSEELGAATAAAAAAGVGGSSVENYNRTVETAYGLQSELRSRAVKSETYIAREQMGSTITDAVDSFDRNVYNADRDFTYYGPTKGPSLLGNLATLAVAAGATAAGAPQIGEAVLRAKTANMQANYGDAAGASKSFGQALNAFKGGVGEVRDQFRFRDNTGGSSNLQQAPQSSAQAKMLGVPELWPGQYDGAINPGWRNGSSVPSGVLFR